MPTETPQNRRIKAADVRDLCGGISDMTLWRWMQDREFPPPVRIARRRYWKEAEVTEWLEAQNETEAA